MAYGIDISTPQTIVLDACLAASGLDAFSEELFIDEIEVPAALHIYSESRILVGLGFDEGTVVVLIETGSTIDEFEPVITAVMASISYDSE